MRRRIIKQGNKSFTLTVPAKWIHENSLEGGDEIDIAEDEGNLLITIPERTKKKETVIHVELGDLPPRTIKNILNQSYRKGFDKIKISFKKPDHLKIIKEVTEKTLLGFEVVDESEDACTIQNIAEPSYDKYDIILRKIFLNIKNDAQEFYDELKKGKLENMNKWEEQKNNIDNFTNFLRRVIINNKVGGTRNSYLLFYLISHLSLIQHAYYYLYKYIAENKGTLGKDIINLFKESNDTYNMLYEAYYKKDLELAHNVRALRDDLQKNKIYPMLEKKTGIDAVALYHIGEIIRITSLASTIIFTVTKELEEA